MGLHIMMFIPTVVGVLFMTLGAKATETKLLNEDDLKGLTSLSLINPWHAAMKLFDFAAEDEKALNDEPGIGPRVAMLRSWKPAIPPKPKVVGRNKAMFMRGSLF